MKKDWLQDIGRRMSRYERTAPKGTLEDIRREMTRRGLQPAVKSSSLSVSWGRMVAAVVALALVGGALLLWHNRTGVPSNSPELQANRAIALEQHSTVSSTPQSATSESGSSIPVVASIYNKVSIWAKSMTQKDTDRLIAKTETGESPATTFIYESTGSMPTETKKTESVDKSRQRKGKIPSAPERRDYVAESPMLAHNRSRRSAVSVGAYVSGMGYTGYSSGTGMPTYLARMLGEASDPTSSTGSTNLFSTMLMSSRASVTHASHKQPVKVGISVRVPLTKRWSVTTGLNYSYLSSDLEFTGADGVEDIDQQLHYIGVPVNVNYSVYRSRHLNVYVSAGGSVEKLVKGKAKSQTTSDGTGQSMNGQSVTGDIHESRPQWSVNAAAGVEYRFTPMFSVYAEPGVSHHFNNGSDVVNIYKDKPTNFSIGVGLRMNIGTKK
ncbi:MAG: porin family protein [Prevotella sp.]